MPDPSFPILDTLRPVLEIVSGLLAIGTAVFVERSCIRRGLLPPGFRTPWRRVTALLLLAMLFWVAIFSPLAMIGSGSSPAPEGGEFKGVSIPQLFALQILLSFVTVAWFLLGFAVRPRPGPVVVIEPMPIEPIEGIEPIEATAAEGPGAIEAAEAPLQFEPLGEILAPRIEMEEVPPPAPPVRPTLGRQFAAQLGFRAPSPLGEIGFGLVAGFAIWFAVLAALSLIVLTTASLGGERYLPKQAPAMIPWIAGLPFGIRILLSLSAGLVEETFFRGLLQPRVGIAASTICFVLAHAAYGSPFMLIGVTLLSLIYAFLVRWRQNLWPAIAAHALFDGIQLLVVIPAAIRFLPT